MGNYLKYLFLFAQFVSLIKCSNNGSTNSGKDSPFPIQEILIENTLSGAKVNVTYCQCETKSKTNLVFIHGSPGSSLDFNKYLQSVALGKKYCLVVFDRPGFGKSMRGLDPPSLELQAQLLTEALESFREKLGLTGSVQLAGHSYGGSVVLQMIKYWEGKLGRVYLLASPSVSKWEEPSWYNRLAEFTFFQLVLPESWNQSNREMITLKSDLLDMEKQFTSFTVPIILIHGTEDFLVPYQHSTSFISMHPKSPTKLITMEKSGHFIPWTQFGFLESTFLSEELPIKNRNKL